MSKYTNGGIDVDMCKAVHDTINRLQTTVDVLVCSNNIDKRKLRNCGNKLKKVKKECEGERC